MIEQDEIRKELEEQLEKVKQRLQILDMMEHRLFEMRELAQRAIDEEMTEQEIKKINQRVRDLEQQVKLLDSEGTPLLS